MYINVKMKTIITVLLIIAVMSCTKYSRINSKDETSNKAKKPNVVILYVDDLGYGDIGSYGLKGATTPNIDQLAAKGIRFTDAHSSAATCTPSRYSLLTGQYAFRNNAAILPGDAPLIIDHTKPTLPKMFQKAGYKTAVIGKWHLGLGSGNVDWNKPVSPGPLELGFDYSFLLPATGDRVPTVYLEGHHVVGLDPNDPITVSYEAPIGERPVGTLHPKLLKQTADLQHSASVVNGISRIGWMVVEKAQNGWMKSFLMFLQIKLLNG
ncbi:sulfatase-like hydrolase/transferase [Colwellia sp. MSW7]|uniref:Sulfatase-like hydrolase/transferase n=1 Tax=Colwellia maritima TaxID=2912588 RepID=A0ABS9X5A4_9GAMM|nr:sulfatase-like hydrolase/transferase [Colwellia maritima]